MSALPVDSAVRRCLARARDGKTLTSDEALTLIGARREDLHAVMAVAAARRDTAMAEAGRPGQVTYSRKVFIPVSRLCRDRCHYCTFATVPGRVKAPYLSVDEVLKIARQGAAVGCHEALFTLGDAPEDRWVVAREWLDAHGYESTVHYVRALAITVLEQTGLLPHLNPGVMTWEQLQRLRPVAPSMGMMLETTSQALFEQPSGPHFGSPDKDPTVRLRVLEDAGRCAVPFTTGLLVGIGETLADRVESIFAVREVSRRYGHVQECIVQNFRAKGDTAMRAHPDAGSEEYLATIAVTRLVLDVSVSVQAPPNLSHLGVVANLLAAGVDDLGGVSPVTPDHVNPERPWPAIAQLEHVVGEAGLHLIPRLTAHPRFVRSVQEGSAQWVDPRLHQHVLALADERGMALPGAVCEGRPWQAPVQPRPETPAEANPSEVYGAWEDTARLAQAITEAPAVSTPSDARAALARLERNPSGGSDAEYLTLLQAEGEDLAALARLADDVRKDRVGETVTWVHNRNLNFSNVCFVGCRFCAFAQRPSDAGAVRLSLDEVARRAEDAWQEGATEICMQGGIDPALSPQDYLDLVGAIKQVDASLHVHAFSPMEVVMVASRAGMSIAEWLDQLRDAGVGSLPGTAAEILDDEVRWVLTKGKLPTSTWVEVVESAHRAGVPTTSTMMFGHVDHPRHWVQHLRVLRGVQERTGGITEFVPLPFIHMNAPVYLAGVARPGPSERDVVAVTAVARLLLDGAIPNIQASWVKVGERGVRRLLHAGANDVGGTLMEESISAMAGSIHGDARTPAQMRAMVEPLGRPFAQRTTLYARVAEPTAAVPEG